MIRCGPNRARGGPVPVRHLVVGRQVSVARPGAGLTFVQANTNRDQIQSRLTGYTPSCLSPNEWAVAA
jgi:hypothetical protein